MAFVEGSHKTFKAAADLSALQYTAIKLDASGNAVSSTAATDKVVGILMNAPKSGDAADVRLRTASGTSQAVAGGTWAVGDLLTPTTGGKLIATTNSGDTVVGQALVVAATSDVAEFLPMTVKY